MNNSVQTGSRGFSLVEMMVVLLILSVVLGIIIPALGYARNTARKNATSALMTQLATASASFQLDERRLPGYFSARDMGHADNAGSEGFSQMCNILLDLSGGIVNTSNATPTTVQVGPHAGARAFVAPEYIGGSTQVTGSVAKAYFRPDPKTFTIVSGRFGTANNTALPELVDLFGTPILAWGVDEVPNSTNEFVSANSATRARFYWAQNASALRSVALGRIGGNQTTESKIGSNSSPANNANPVVSLRALLGAPNFPDPANAATPAAIRAPIVFHSAGYNGLFMGNFERGGKLAGDGAVTYLSTKDNMEDFDDLIVKVSN